MQRSICAGICALLLYPSAPASASTVFRCEDSKGHITYTLHGCPESASLDLQVRNLADRQHAYTWYDNFFWPSGSAQPMSSPGAPRSVTLALNLKM